MLSLAPHIALLGALATSVLAHGTVAGFKADGVYYGGWNLQYFYALANKQPIPLSAGWYAENLDNGFIDGTSYGNADIICHKNAIPANMSATVKAGGTIDFQWTLWPDSHFGPLFTYVANCNGNCSATDKTALLWVKIDQAAIDLSTQTWPTAEMIKNNNTWTTTVPSNLAPGQYVFRHEIIAMHGAGSQNGAQNYPQVLGWNCMLLHPTLAHRLTRRSSVHEH
jgi:lytic cellulose monooxygenase (C1-hydroxylating)